MSSQINTTPEGKATITAFVSLGSNLPSKYGSPEATVLAAISRLAELSRTAPVVSSLYSSEPIDCPAGTPVFVNAAVSLEVHTSLTASGLLVKLLKLEAEFGRRRGEVKNQARSLDLDLITYGNQIVNEDSLILPHPRAEQRRFVLQPIAEIDPSLILPGQSQTVAQLLNGLNSAQASLRKLVSYSSN